MNPPRPTSSSPAGASATPTRKPVVLWIDPHPAALPADLGLEVVQAWDSPGAMRLLETHKGSLRVVVAAQELAEGPGAELLTTVHQCYPSVVTVLVGEHPDAEQLVQALEQGQLVGFVVRPWEPGQLKEQLQKALERAEALRKVPQVETLQSEQNHVLAFISAGVGHQINNPCAVLRMNLEALREQLNHLAHAAKLTGTMTREQAEQVAQDGQSVIQDCLGAVDKLYDVSRDLRVLASYPGGEVPLVPMDMNSAVQRAVRFLGAQLVYAADLEQDLGQLPTVRGDESRMTQVVINLLTHAIQDLEAVQDQRLRRIRISTRYSGKAIELEVSDNGCGMDEAHVAALFEPSTAPSFGPTGFVTSLALCKQLVSQWGGQIHAQSRPNQGTTYRITLPVQSRRPSMMPQDPSTQAPARPAEILVIDDDPAVLRAVQRCFRGLHQVQTTDSGKEAMELLKSRAFDAVVCDLQMPSPNGTDVYRFLEREQPELTGRIVFMTGGALTQAVGEFIDYAEQQNIVVLQKPFTNETIRGAVAKVLRRS